MEDIIITEEEISFTPEIMDKLIELRKERERYNLPNPKGKKKSSGFKIGDLVYITLNGTEFTGSIEKVKNKDDWAQYYDVNTPYGVIKGVHRNEIRPRKLEDLSNIIVPEVLKKLGTRHLLSLLRSTYLYGTTHYQGNEYTGSEIKAAMIGRPHLSNARERKNVRQRTKK